MTTDDAGPAGVAVRILTGREGRYYLVPEAIAEDLRVPAAVQDHIREVATKGDVQGYTDDVNALLLTVLRQSYQDSTADMSFYTQKLAYYNALTQAFQQGLAGLRLSRP